jgi:hypothetical protein
LKAKELNLIFKNQFGGPLLAKSHAKTARPFSATRPQFIALQSELNLFKGFQSTKKITKIILHHARENKISIRDLKISSHRIHFTMKSNSRKRWQCFIRSVAGLISRWRLNSEKGRAAKKSLWVHRPWSVILFGKDSNVPTWRETINTIILCLWSNGFQDEIGYYNTC